VKGFFDIVRQNLCIELSSAQIEAFNTYEDLLLDWNEKFNLTSITDPSEIHIKHFIDSWL
jgi:16S rRNA (guanine527-N7)-methyltransferase